MGSRPRDTPRLNLEAPAWHGIYMTASWWLEKRLISGNLAIWTVHVLEKVLFYCFRVPRGINSHFCSKTQWQMFLLVFSGRHVGAHTNGHQHGVSIQISINLGKKFLYISCIRKITVTRILARVFAYLLSFISQILDLIYWTVLILIHFEWRDTENQQLHQLSRPSCKCRVMQKLRNSSVVYHKTKNQFGAKICTNISFQLLSYIIKVKSQEYQ